MSEFNMEAINALPAFKATDYLKSPEALAGFLTDLFQAGDARVIAGSLGELCREYSMTEIAKKTGLQRESLYKALRYDANAKPQFDTIFKVVKALGMELKVVPINEGS